MQDGKVVGLLSQEKIDNVKNSADFPSGAIDALLVQCGIARDDIDEIAIAGLAIYPKYCYDFLFEDKNSSASLLARISKAAERSVFGKLLPFLFTLARSFRRKRMEDEGRKYLVMMLKEAGLSAVPVTYIEHHTCHARSAYHGLSSGDEPALIFTADGSGDKLSATVTVAGGGRWERIAATSADASLGGLYANTTRFLGMKILEDEHKVMGLAPYCKGRQEEVYQRIFAHTIGFDPKEPLAFRAAMDS
jgi:carbamoyltransferase